MVRYEGEVDVRLGESRFVNHLITNLTPVSESRRLKAPELVASVVRPAGVPRESGLSVAQKELMDLIVASLKWVKQD